MFTPYLRQIQSSFFLQENLINILIKNYLVCFFLIKWNGNIYTWSSAFTFAFNLPHKITSFVCKSKFTHVHYLDRSLKNNIQFYLNYHYDNFFASKDFTSGIYITVHVFGAHSSTRLFVKFCFSCILTNYYLFTNKYPLISFLFFFLKTQSSAGN